MRNYQNDDKLKQTFFSAVRWQNIGLNQTCVCSRMCVCVVYNGPNFLLAFFCHAAFYHLFIFVS